MAIVVTLSPELETLLIDRARDRGQDVDFVASELLASVLEWENKDSAAAVESIQQGLDNFAAGQFRSFQDFAQEQRHKYNLPIDS